ncbi:MAG: NusG domain II-containing protein [Thermodesulfovibrionales bacterium]
MRFSETIKSTTLADRVLLATLFLVSLLGIAFVNDVLPHGTEVSIEVEGKVMYRYPLDTDRSVKVEGPRGFLTVEIKNKKVRVIEASCPNRLCEKQGWISRGAIICLPNRISIVVRGNERPDGGALDAITG